MGRKRRGLTTVGLVSGFRSSRTTGNDPPRCALHLSSSPRHASARARRAWSGSTFRIEPDPCRCSDPLFTQSGPQRARASRSMTAAGPNSCTPDLHVRPIVLVVQRKSRSQARLGQRGFRPYTPGAGRWRNGSLRTARRLAPRRCGVPCKNRRQVVATMTFGTMPQRWRNGSTSCPANSPWRATRIVPRPAAAPPRMSV